ncbi:slipin family protein [Photobacterium galatheae]|uniref:Stomatin/prohibitin-family membrane protease subunit n=1 Tax=Photobacterium galatheae TaxID=1654360 RepID=A0A066RSY8_9GAMM|nr:stomatin/prohibitin-family membrane protease subunit [Photobacterium galatheae]MCM0151399.1 slipin family protein [Photobacterium galatheae]
MFRKKLIIADNQRVLVLKDQQFETVLTAGKHLFWDFRKALSFITFDINTCFVTDENLIRLYHKHDTLAEHILHWKLAGSEVGMLYLNGMLQGIVASGEHLYVWKDAGEFRLDIIDISQAVAVENSLLQLMKRAGANTSGSLIRSKNTVAVKPVADIHIDKQHIGLLYLDGKLEKTLSPGQYGFWQLNRQVEVKIYDQRSLLLDISGQEILSKDRVSLRINLSASIRVVDAVLAASRVDKVEDYIYKTLQLALREAVGTQTLDDLLNDKLYVNETVRTLVADLLQAVGVTLDSVGMKDIILPGEMKAILNQVVEAQKAAEANVIKRREETAATRSLHNTAKVMENNPTLLRLKELEALEKVAEKIDSLTVHNGLEGLMKGVVKIPCI